MTKAQTNRKLNAIWEELRGVKEGLAALNPEQYTKAMDAIGQRFAVAVEGTKVEPVDMVALAREVERLIGERPALEVKIDPLTIQNLPELTKIIGDLRDDAAQKAVAEVLDKLTPLLTKSKGKDKPAVLKLPKKGVEIYGKALVKIDGNSAANPLFVQLSDGENAVDLDKLFRISISTGAAGSVDSGGGTGTTIEDPLEGYTQARVDLSGDPLYIGYENKTNYIIVKSNLTTGVVLYYKAAGHLATGTNWADRTTSLSYVEANQLYS